MHECADRGEHIVQLFDTPESRRAVVSRFVQEGLSTGAPVLVVAEPKHWALVAQALAALGVDHQAAAERSQLIYLDASVTLQLIMRNGVPDALAFERMVGRLVKRMAAKGPGLRIYGEMVDVLAEEGDFEAAQQLEQLWNELALKCPFTLLCGYCSAHFGPQAAERVLHDICGAHTRVDINSADLLGTWLLERQPSTRFA